MIRAPLTGTQVQNQSDNAPEPPDQTNRQTIAQRAAFGCHHVINRALGVIDPGKALNQAAKTGDLQMVSRLLDERTVTAEAHLHSAACKAAWHGNAEVLKKMLDSGVDPDKVLTGDEHRRSPGMFKLGGKPPRENHSVDKLKPETVRVLLKTNGINPDTEIRIFDSWSTIYFTAAELINTNPGNENREEICKLLVSHDKANPNTAICFQKKAAFVQYSKIDNEKLIEYSGTDEVSVNLLGQAFMFDNLELVKHLLTLPKLNPGMPRGTGAAENLLIIFMDRYSHWRSSGTEWRYRDLITALREKIVNSNTFTEQLLSSQNPKFKEQFLTLVSLGSESVQTQVSSALNSQLNSEIRKILPDYH